MSTNNYSNIKIENILLFLLFPFIVRTYTTDVVVFIYLFINVILFLRPTQHFNQCGLEETRYYSLVVALVLYTSYVLATEHIVIIIIIM